MNTDEVGLLCANKIKTFPVVNSTYYWLTKSYTKLKETNFVTKSTCTIAECTLKNSLVLAYPLVHKFKYQVSNLDSIACNQLEKLETAFPIIKSDTDSLVTQSRELLTKTVEPMCAGYATFKTNAETKCKTLKTSLTEKILDYHNLIVRMRALTNAINNNLKQQAEMALRILELKFSTLCQLLTTFSLNKSKLSAQVKAKLYLTKDKIELYKEYLEVLCKQFTVQDGRSLQNAHSMEDRTQIIIRRTLGNSITAFHLAYSKVSNFLPIVNKRISISYQPISDLYQIYKKDNDSFNGVIRKIVLREVQGFSHRTQCTMNLFLKKLNNSAIVSWFVPNFESFGILDNDFEEFEINKPDGATSQNLERQTSEEDLAITSSLDLTYGSNSIKNMKSSDNSVLQN